MLYFDYYNEQNPQPGFDQFNSEVVIEDCLYVGPTLVHPNLPKPPEVLIFSFTRRLP